MMDRLPNARFDSSCPRYWRCINSGVGVIGTIMIPAGPCDVWFLSVIFTGAVPQHPRLLIAGYSKGTHSFASLTGPGRELCSM
ncbi:hypothetical protein P167DRAFT_127505 [Morchella conica CCBAS932]|uniref:Uncharacterized protein n=1 Tax=Morchella conica CCBAS932 TaxID=1392247 RepID=A0A3N4L494_9PEZI|nr:hypothetical protein P167DRAFT_127505 [Morchella conica CCBAS932]